MNMMKTQMPALACLFSALGALVCWAEDVEFVDCAKCEKRMRLAADASGATVNLARLRDDNPDAATLERRKAAMTARAQSILAAARDTRMPNRKRPLMGWSSWNTFGLEIGDRLILEIAEAMATNGLKAAGYRYVNIDDGFFCGHDEHGRLRIIEKRFPKGLKPVVDGIHALGMKAGIYSDAGIDTCGSNNDPAGRGSGLYGHDREDCEFHFVENGFDFIKVDYCGGARMGLDERTRYTEIANAIRATGRDVRFNVCRWAYPGTWISEIAESWRTTGDIRASWERVKELVEKNFYLSPYASLGHYNDMDMLEVGQLKGRMKTWPVFGKRDKGFTREEETTHFGLWCILSSPLLMGCDVRTIDPESLKLATNPYLLSMNQNDLGVQAYPIRRDGDAVVFVKDCGERFGTARYVALYNGSDKDYEFSFAFSELELGGKVGVVDLVEGADIGEGEGNFVMKVAPHASKFYRMDAERRLTQAVYESENAYLHDFQTVNPATEALTPHFVSERKASGQAAVGLLGMRPGNDLVWKEVRVAADGLYDFEFACFNRAPGIRTFDVEVDGKKIATVEIPYQAWEPRKVRIEVPLTAGVHRVRLSNDSAPMPVIDCLRVRPRKTGMEVVYLFPAAKGLAALPVAFG